MAWQAHWRWACCDRGRLAMPATDAVLTSLLREVADTEAALAAERDEQARRIGGRLRDSVVRPLRQLTGTVAGGAEPGGGAGVPAALADRPWALARPAAAPPPQAPRVAA